MNCKKNLKYAYLKGLIEIFEDFVLNLYLSCYNFLQIIIIRSTFTKETNFTLIKKYLLIHLFATSFLLFSMSFSAFKLNVRMMKVAKFYIDSGHSTTMMIATWWYENFVNQRLLIKLHAFIVEWKIVACNNFLCEVIRLGVKNWSCRS